MLVPVPNMPALHPDSPPGAVQKATVQWRSYTFTTRDGRRCVVRLDARRRCWRP